MMSVAQHRRLLLLALVVVGASACTETTSSPAAQSGGTVARSPAAEVTSPPATVATPLSETTLASTNIAPAASTTTSTTTTIAATTTATTTTTTTTTTSTTTTTEPPTSTPYVVPVGEPGRAGWGTTHAGYPATDIFLRCGAELVSPVNGSVLEVRRSDGWDPSIDNPATRGGKSVTMLGDDGVRYYMAHFSEIVEPLAPGDRISAGQYLGIMGTTGRSSACHVHFSISPTCPGKEWAVRRGAIWPYPYLNAWRNGEQVSPVAEVASWEAANPDACETAMAHPNASDS